MVPDKRNLDEVHARLEFVARLLDRELNTGLVLDVVRVYHPQQRRPEAQTLIRRQYHELRQQHLLLIFATLRTITLPRDILRLFQDRGEADNPVPKEDDEVIPIVVVVNERSTIDVELKDGLEAAVARPKVV